MMMWVDAQAVLFTRLVELNASTASTAANKKIAPIERSRDENIFARCDG